MPQLSAKLPSSLCCQALACSQARLRGFQRTRASCFLLAYWSLRFRDAAAFQRVSLHITWSHIRHAYAWCRYWHWLLITDYAIIFADLRLSTLFSLIGWLADISHLLIFQVFISLHYHFQILTITWYYWSLLIFIFDTLISITFSSSSSRRSACQLMFSLSPPCRHCYGCQRFSPLSLSSVACRAFAFASFQSCRHIQLCHFRQRAALYWISLITSPLITLMPLILHYITPIFANIDILIGWCRHLRCLISLTCIIVDYDIIYWISLISLITSIFFAFTTFLHYAYAVCALFAASFLRGFSFLLCRRGWPRRRFSSRFRYFSCQDTRCGSYRYRGHAADDFFVIFHFRRHIQYVDVTPAFSHISNDRQQ